MKTLLRASLLLCLFASFTFAQTLPYIFKNSSRYADSEIYVGLVGQFPGMGNVWMDMTKSQLKPMTYADNTVPGPAWGNTPDGKNKYAAMFYKLSDLQNKTIQIPQGLFGCRIFLSFKSPMYIYFHQTGGYAGANLQNPMDPNDGIRWELVELTWGNAGLWTNTSRVDSYQYPMGLEVTGYSGGVGGSYAASYNARVNDGSAPNVNKKIGELLSHQAILNAWPNRVETAFLGCKLIKTHSMDNEPIIEQPSKIDDFKANGAFKDYFASYINDIWSTYRTKDLLLNIGDRGTWRGRVTGDRFDFYDPADNSQATIYWKPNTQDAIEGAGALATTTVTPPSVKYDEDLMIQAQVCAAINRHAIYTSAAVGEVQYNHDATRFFKIAPYNQYVKFFHSTDISYESLTYAFAYDDVGDHSSTIQCTFPTKVTVVIGGYGESTPTPVLIPAKIEAEAFSNMLGIQTETTTDTGGGSNVGFIDANDWMEYFIQVPQDEEYNLKLRVASKDGDGLLQILNGTTDTTLAIVPKTGDWQIWTTINTKIKLTKGQKTIKFLVKKGGFNINWIEFEKLITTNLDDSNVASVSSFNVFPSPAKNEIYIKNNSENGSVTIWNLTGTKLAETESNIIDISSFQSGVYLVKSGNQTRKFIKE